MKEWESLSFKATTKKNVGAANGKMRGDFFLKKTWD